MASFSPYASTPVVGDALDIMEHRNVPHSSSDPKYIIEPKYRYRPDLLAYDLYGTTSLWWVFTARNPATLRNPIFDMKEGKTIFLVPKNVLLSSLDQ